MRKELRHELLRDLIASTELPEGGLSLTAPLHLFLKPCWKTILRSQLVEGPVTQHWPVPFDGNCAWDTYQAQFEPLADLNGWSDTEKSAHWAISLRGAAATVLTNLHPSQRRSYKALTAVLESHFGMAHQTELNRSRLKARSRQREETLTELPEDVERLVRLV